MQARPHLNKHGIRYWPPKASSEFVRKSTARCDNPGTYLYTCSRNNPMDLRTWHKAHQTMSAIISHNWGFDKHKTAWVAIGCATLLGSTIALKETQRANGCPLVVLLLPFSPSFSFLPCRRSCRPCRRPHCHRRGCRRLQRGKLKQEPCGRAPERAQTHARTKRCRNVSWQLATSF